MSTSFYPTVAALDIAPTFFIFATVGVLGIVFVAAQVPETRGKTLKEFEDEIRPLPMIRKTSPAPVVVAPAVAACAAMAPAALPLKNDSSWPDSHPRPTWSDLANTSTHRPSASTAHYSGQMRGQYE